MGLNDLKGFECKTSWNVERVSSYQLLFRKFFSCTLCIQIILLDW
jgi:hypothetical protein